MLQWFPSEWFQGSAGRMSITVTVDSLSPPLRKVTVRDYVD